MKRPFRPNTLNTLLTLLLAIALILAAACSSGSGVPTSDVAGAIPWPASESLSYVVKDRKGADLGKIVLAVDAQGSTTKLSQRFQGANTTDNSTVVVDSRTLKPVSSSREIETSRDDEKIEVTYSDQGALIKQGDDKQSGLSVPEHAYDNDSSLFLWRTLPFAEGYHARYITVVTNRRSRADVDLRVVGKESVRVPAGTFTAWRLEIRATGVKQVAWYADTPARTLVRYDNDNGLIYELERVP
ncbi:MAG TPA: DUF3108 domain-containing protein [Dehalococcoidia bacterium]|nr:DUF3108 domain-containing protein [Dehalococcoidia bacterium]